MTTSPVTAPVVRPITLPRLLQQNRSFRNVFIAQIVSQGGDWFTMVPLIILLDQLTGRARSARCCWASRHSRLPRCRP